MKQLILNILFLLGIFSLQAQEMKVDTIKVAGNCEMCEKRIESASVGKGVQQAQWDIKTGLLAIKYNAEKTSLREIEQRIAAAGHDTEHVKAKDETYEKLHRCCQYPRLKD